MRLFFLTIKKVWQHWDLHCKPGEFKWSSLEGIHTVKVENKSSHKADMSYIWHVLSAEYGSLTATFSTVHKGIKCLNTFCLGLWVCKVLQHHWACSFFPSNTTMFGAWHFGAFWVLLVIKPPQATMSVSLGTFSVGPFNMITIFPQSSNCAKYLNKLLQWQKSPYRYVFQFNYNSRRKILDFCYLHHCYSQLRICQDLDL